MDNYRAIRELFDQLKKKPIVCFGVGKHFKNITYPFLRDSGLIKNLVAFTGTNSNKSITIDGEVYPSISMEEVATFTREDMDDVATFTREDTLILVAVTGYKEIISQIRANDKLSQIEAIPSIYIEALYEDMLMLSADKPPANFRKNDREVIPRVIHTFWFSGEHLPEKYQKCLDSWRKYAPDFEIKIWNLESYKPKGCTFFDQAIERGNWAFASDYARADVLRKFGGVYMDLDVEMLRPIDDLLYNDAYMSFESLSRIECGSGMGAKPGNKILDEICKSYEARPYLKEDGYWDNSTCPVRYTQVIEKHGLVKNGGFQFVEDITIYPFEVLTGKSFDSGIIYQTDLSYTTHHHNGNWVPESAWQAMDQRYREIREFMARRE